MTRRSITEEEIEVLRAALYERGTLSFPLGGLAAGALSGAIYRIQKSQEPYKLSARHKLAAMLSDGYSNVFTFIQSIGPENVHVWYGPEPDGHKVFFLVKLKPNKSLKADAVNGAA